MLSRSGMSRRRFLGAAGAGAAGVVGAAMMGSGIVSAEKFTGMSPARLDKLYVGIQSDDKPGFWQWNANGKAKDWDGNKYGRGVPVGIEADFARAVAVAVWNKPLDLNLGANKIAEQMENLKMVEWVGTDSTTRWEHLFGITKPVVDVVFRSITYTMGRDAYQSAYQAGCTFMPTYFYDGADVIVYGTYEDPPQDILVAVGIGTTTADAIKEEIDKALAEEPPADPPWDYILTQNSSMALEAWRGDMGDGYLCKYGPDEYPDGYDLTKHYPKAIYKVCDTPPTTDPDPYIPGESGHEGAAYYDFGQINATGNDASTLIPELETCGECYLYFTERDDVAYGNEPLTPAVRENEDNWADIVRWVMYALMHAEIAGIVKKVKDPLTQTEVDMSFGAGMADHLGLDSEWAYRVIKAVGNYGEIYYRWYGVNDGERSKNNTVKNCGLIYAPAFR